MARPTKLTKELQARICEHLEGGAPRRFAAGAVGIDENTFSRWFHRGAAAEAGNPSERIYREFYVAVNRAEAVFEKTARDLILSGSKINPNLALKWLGRRFPAEYGRQDNVEQQNPEDKAAQAASLRQLLIERSRSSRSGTAGGRGAARGRRPVPSDSAWVQAEAKRLDWSGVAEKCGPEESVASHMARYGGAAKLSTALTDPEVELLVYDLDFWARRQQVPPTYWEFCVALAGRGFGKTWMGARWAIKKASEGKEIGALIGPTAADVRDTMIRGSSGILALSPPWFMPVYEPSKRRVTWPNGVYAICYSADKYDRLRGPNTGWVWGDEPCTWKHEMAALDQIPLFNRIGTKTRPPQTLLTGTPRPLKKLEELIQKPTTALVTGSSLANAANLAPSTVANMRALAGTRWGKQEVLGQLMMDVPGAIFGRAKWGRVAPPTDGELRSSGSCTRGARSPHRVGRPGADERDRRGRDRDHGRGLQGVGALRRRRHAAEEGLGDRGPELPRIAARVGEPGDRRLRALRLRRARRRGEQRRRDGDDADRHRARRSAACRSTCSRCAPPRRSRSVPSR
jgi:hypothetical protein